MGDRTHSSVRRLVIAAVLVVAAVAGLPGFAHAAGSPRPPQVAGPASTLVRYAYFTTGEAFPFQLRHISDFPVAYAEFDPGTDFAVLFVGAVEAPGRADFTVRGVLHRDDGTPFDSFVEVKRFAPHLSWYPVRRMFAMERLRADRRAGWTLTLFVDDRPVGRFSFTIVADPLWAQRPRGPTVATAPPPTPTASAPPRAPALVRLEMIGPPRATVQIDGRAAQTLDDHGRLEVSLAPGRHRIEASAAGYQPLAGDVSVPPDRPVASHTLALVELPPPTLTLLAPVAAGPPVRDSRVPLRFLVAGESRPAALRLIADGKLVQEVRAPAGAAARQPWVVESAPVPLVEGDNRVTAEAIDEFGRRSTQLVTISREPFVTVDVRVVAGAQVVVTGPQFRQEVTADASGKVQLKLLSGAYRVEVSAAGFRPATDAFDVAPNQAPFSRAIGLVRVPPPSIVVLAPTPGSVVQTEQVTLAVEVRSTEPLAKLRVSVGGARAGIHDADPKAPVGEPWRVDVPVRLGVGENQISLEASDRTGLVSVVTATLTREELRVARPAPVEPPKIQFSYPPADAILSRDKTPVIALVTDDVGVTDVELSVNGEKVPSLAAPGAPVSKINVNAVVPLEIGENVFAITATNRAGKAAQVIRVAIRTAPVVATPPPPPPPKGERFAVIIGVGLYDSPQVPRLRFAENDARGIHTVLTTKGGFKPDNVLLLTDSAALKPTLLNIKRALGEWLFKKAGKDDMVFVYYAGHGAPEVDASGTDRDGLSKYLIPRDADPESLFVTAFAMDDIETIFRRLQAERVVFVIDTCFSGAAGGRTFTRQVTRSGQLTGEFLERLSHAKGRVVISAAGPNELALELPELRHGLFTHYVIKGLEGEADRDSDGIVTVNELFDYVQRHVSKRAREENSRQTPTMTGAVQDLPLVEIRR